MERWHSLKNSIVQKSVILSGAIKQNIEPIIGKNSDNIYSEENIDGTLTKYDYINACNLFICKNNKWKFENDVLYIENVDYIVSNLYDEKDNNYFADDIYIIKEECQKIFKPIQKDYILDDCSVYNSKVVLNDNEIKKFNLYINYDNYYKVPRIWINAYRDDIELKIDELYEEIKEDYVNRTISYEFNPFLNKNMICIHPCNHANIMKKLIKGHVIEEYMIVFLNIVYSIFPFLVII